MLTRNQPLVTWPRFVNEASAYVHFRASPFSPSKLLPPPPPRGSPICRLSSDPLHCPSRRIEQLRHNRNPRKVAPNSFSLRLSHNSPSLFPSTTFDRHYSRFSRTSPSLNAIRKRLIIEILLFLAQIRYVRSSTLRENGNASPDDFAATRLQGSIVNRQLSAIRLPLIVHYPYKYRIHALRRRVYSTSPV